MKSAQINKTISRPTALEKRKEWYLDKEKIREKTQFKWTMEERIILYRLRVEEKKSIPEIQRYFRKLYKIPITTDIEDKKDKFSRTRIHNQIRIVKGIIKGLCYKCRQPLTEADMRYIKKEKNSDPFLKLCKKCRKEISIYKKKRRNELLESNICPICGKREILEGKTTCSICLSSTSRLRYIEGLCGRCGKLPIAKNSISLCTICLEKQCKIRKKNTKRK